MGWDGKLRSGPSDRLVCVYFGLWFLVYVLGLTLSRCIVMGGFVFFGVVRLHFFRFGYRDH